MREQVGTLTPKLERLIHTLEWLRIEEFTKSAWCGIGRTPAERAWLPVPLDRLTQWQCSTHAVCGFVADSLGLRRSDKQSN